MKKQEFNDIVYQLKKYVYEKGAGCINPDLRVALDMIDDFQEKEQKLIWDFKKAKIAESYLMHHQQLKTKLEQIKYD